MIKKILKTTLIILLSIILLAVIFLLVVSHNTAFYRTVYPGIDDSMSDYPYMNETVPSDFVARTVHGITVKAPAECLNSKESQSIPFNGNNLMVMVSSISEDRTYLIDIDNKDPFPEKDYEHYFNKIGIEKPDRSIDEIIYLRDKFNSGTCKGLHGKDLLIFNFEAYSKKTVAAMETPYFYHGKNFDGLVCEVYSLPNKMTNVMISNPDLRYYATIFIRSTDEKLIHQVIAGIDPSGFLAGDVL